MNDLRDPDLVFVEMVLGWTYGSEVISSFSTILFFWYLNTFHFKDFFTKITNQDSKTVEGVIKIFIYGVRSVSAQSEVFIDMIAEELKEEYPQVAIFLKKFRYVDDPIRVIANHEEGKILMKIIDEQFQNLKASGWVKPHWKKFLMIFIKYKLLLSPGKLKLIHST